MIQIGGLYGNDDFFPLPSRKEHDSKELCLLLSSYDKEIRRLRFEAYKHILDIFQTNPKRKYDFYWDNADEVWDSELLDVCPVIIYYSSDHYSSGFRSLEKMHLTRINVEDNTVVADTIPLGDIVNVELILDSMLGAKNWRDATRSGFHDQSGFYYQD